MGQVNWVRYLPSWAPSHIVGSFKRVHRSAASVFSASGWRPALITHNHSVHTAHTPLLIFKHVYQNQPLHWNRNLSITLAQHATARIFTGQSTGSTCVQDGSVSVGSQLEGTTLWPIHFFSAWITVRLWYTGLLYFSAKTYSFKPNFDLKPNMQK